MIYSPVYYNGIDIVLARPNRYQLANKSLLAGTGMTMLDKRLLTYGYRLDECSVRLAGYGRAPSKTTKQLLLGPITSQADLDKRQCYVEQTAGIKIVRSYLPQDANDFQPLEANMYDESTDDDDDASAGKDYAPTKFANYRFWLNRAIEKLFTNTTFPSTHNVPYSIIDTDVIPRLLPALGDTLFLDIECTPKDNHLICIGFTGLSSDRVYVWFPWDYNRRSRGDITAAAVAWFKHLGSCKLVAHNAFFDLSFLFNFYKMPFSKNIEDTMIMHNRLFAESEKDLGHCIAYYLNQPYHKDTAGRFYISNVADMQRMARYNAADVAATRGLWHAINAKAKQMDNVASVQQVNASCYPLLLAGCTGMQLNTDRLAKLKADAEAYVTQLYRIWYAMTGEHINFNSGQQICEYLYDKMHFDPPPQRKKTQSGRSADKDALYALKMAHPDCVAIDVLLAAKENNSFVQKMGFEIYYRNENTTD